MVIPKTKSSWILIGSYLGLSVILEIIIDYIYPNFSHIYGSYAKIGSYFLMPILWIIYGIYIYFLGLKLNYKKEFIAPSIISNGTNYITVKDTKYTFFAIPIQYVGLLSLIFGIVMLSIQIVHRYLYL